MASPRRDDSLRLRSLPALLLALALLASPLLATESELTAEQAQKGEGSEATQAAPSERAEETPKETGVTEFEEPPTSPVNTLEDIFSATGADLATLLEHLAAQAKQAEADGKAVLWHERSKERAEPVEATEGQSRD
jgi:hypothetical protein